MEKIKNLRVESRRGEEGRKKNEAVEQNLKYEKRRGKEGGKLKVEIGYQTNFTDEKKEGQKGGKKKGGGKRMGRIKRREEREEKKKEEVSWNGSMLTVQESKLGGR